MPKPLGAYSLSAITSKRFTNESMPSEMFAKSIEVFFPSVTTQISKKPRATRVTVSSKDDDFHGLAVMIFSVQYVHDHPGVKFV